MVGTLLRSMTLTQWRMTLRMPLSCVLALIGLAIIGGLSITTLPFKGQGQALVWDQQERDFQNRSFFPSLSSDLERLCRERRKDILGSHNSLTKTSSATNVTSPGTMQGSGPTDSSKSRQELHNPQKRSSQLRQKLNLNKVGYYSPIQINNTSIVNGRLIKCFDFWKTELKANSFILGVISNGYQIPFIEEPSPVFLKNNRSSLEHEEFVRTEICSLLQKQCIKEVDEPPICVNPLTVSVNSSDKKRLFFRFETC